MKKVSIAKAAAILDKSKQFVRRGLIAGKLPIGVAVKGRGNRYSYHISPKLLMEYAGCSEEDLEIDYENVH